MEISRPVILCMTHPHFSSRLKNAPPVPHLSKVPASCIFVPPSPWTRCRCFPPNLFHCSLRNLYLIANHFPHTLNLVTGATSISRLSLKPFLSSGHSHLGWALPGSQSHLQIFPPPQYLLVIVREPLGSLSSFSSQVCRIHPSS